MSYKYDLEPVEVDRVQSKYRRICTALPVPESISLFETLRCCEPRALGTQVYDGYGNCWIDFTSGILVANAGHSHRHVTKSLIEYIENKPLHSYLFETLQQCLNE